MDNCTHQWDVSEEGSEESRQLCGECREPSSSYAGSAISVSEELFQRWKQGDVDAERRIMQELYLASQSYANAVARGLGFSPDNPSVYVEPLIHEACTALSEAFSRVTCRVRRGKFLWKGDRALLVYYQRRVKYLLRGYRREQDRRKDIETPFTQMEREDDDADHGEDSGDIIDRLSFQAHQHWDTSGSESELAVLSREVAKHRREHVAKLADQLRQMGSEGQAALTIIQELTRKKDEAGSIEAGTIADLVKRLRKSLGLSPTTLYRRFWIMRQQDAVLRLQCQECMRDDDTRQRVLAPIIAHLLNFGYMDAFGKMIDQDQQAKAALNRQLAGIGPQPGEAPQAIEGLVRLCWQLAEFLKSNPDCLKKLRFGKRSN